MFTLIYHCLVKKEKCLGAHKQGACHTATVPEVVNSKKISESLCFPLFIFFTAMSELRVLQVLRGPCEGLKVAPAGHVGEKTLLRGGPIDSE